MDKAARLVVTEAGAGSHHRHHLGRRSAGGTAKARVRHSRRCGAAPPRAAYGENPGRVEADDHAGTVATYGRAEVAAGTGLEVELDAAVQHLGRWDLLVEVIAGSACSGPAKSASPG